MLAPTARDTGGGGLAPIADRAPFLARYAPDGAYPWTVQLPSEGSAELDALAGAADGDLVVVGGFSAPLEIGRTRPFPSRAGTRLRRARFSPEGNLRSVLSDRSDAGRAVAAGP